MNDKRREELLVVMINASTRLINHHYYELQRYKADRKRLKEALKELKEEKR